MISEAMASSRSKGLPGDGCRPLRRGLGHGEHGGSFPLPLPVIMPIRSDCAVPRYLRPRLGRKRAQQRLFRESVISTGPPPVVVSEQEALTELLRCQDLYALQPQHLAEHDLDKLQVTKGGFAERRS